MSFPASPSNNQTAIVNNIAYTYNSATNTWTRNAATNNLTYFSANATFVVGGNISVAGGSAIITPTGSNSNLYLDPDGTADVVLTPNTELFVLSAATATSPTSGAVQITGGAGIGGNVYVGGNLFVTSNAAAGSSTRVEANVPHPFMLMGV